LDVDGSVIDTENVKEKLDPFKIVTGHSPSRKPDRNPHLPSFACVTFYDPLYH
jgi:hypothetical protein